VCTIATLQSFANRHQTLELPDHAKRLRLIKRRPDKPKLTEQANNSPETHPTCLSTYDRIPLANSVVPHNQPFQTDDRDSGGLRLEWVFEELAGTRVVGGIVCAGQKSRRETSFMPLAADRRGRIAMVQFLFRSTDSSEWNRGSVDLSRRQRHFCQN
jgi:hypothetical protein